jgi:hypothetical protein
MSERAREINEELLAVHELTQVCPSAVVHVRMPSFILVSIACLCSLTCTIACVLTAVCDLGVYRVSTSRR